MNAGFERSAKARVKYTVRRACRCTRRPNRCLIMSIKRGFPWVITGSGLATAALAIFFWGGQEVTRGPYLQQSSPTNVIIRWTTHRPLETELRYGLRPDRLEVLLRGKMRGTDHAMLLSGLSPSTQYFYDVAPGSPGSERAKNIHSFFTPPEIGSGSPVRVWVLGDSGTCLPAQEEVRDAFYRFSNNHPADLCLMLGDNAYRKGTEAEYQKALFEMYPSMLSRVSFWPTLGNHDAYSADSATQTGVYFDLFNLPSQGQCGGVMSGTEAYYAFNYANLHFVCLDSDGSDRSPNGPMLAWLRKDLQQNTQAWTVAYWHQPPFTKGSHDSDCGLQMREMRENVLPILEAAGVDVVLSGHSHNYERSFLLDGHYGTSKTFSEAFLKSKSDGRPDGGGPYEKPADTPAPHSGTVYVVAGSSGHPSRLRAVPHPVMCTSLNVAGSLVLDVEGSRLDARFLDATGKIRDQFAILKRHSGHPGHKPLL
ncbi:MAG TPA: metallophosphoesterase family protein [Candidatus Hydrogenedentes bacterium]|nr:metallophosphoesterase family protein [Candidatus Hydrogenedentota bacterium]